VSHRPWLLPASRRVLFTLIVSFGIGAVASSGGPVYAGGDAANLVVATARALVGSPYAYIGDDPSTGFSCIGFVHYVYAQAGVDVPYDLGVAYSSEPRVSVAHLRPGDLLFFSNTVWNGLSHVALYAGDGLVIGADNYTTGVEATRLSDPYWLAHYTGATRPLAALAALATTPQAPAPPTAPPNPTATPRPTSTAVAVRIAAPIVRPQVGDVLRPRIAGAVYSGPGYTYPRVDRLPPRTSLHVSGLQGGWANVAYDMDGAAYAGWIDGHYVARCTVISRRVQPRPR